jgi:glucosyl-3-phosphoglycerate synthase
MISIVIPAWNEANTIRRVVAMCMNGEKVSQVIVVDDQSDDGTADLAREAGAEVMISQRRGKGISMKEGLDAAKNELIVFLDADIDPYPEQTIENLTATLLANQADFVKGSFTRNAGRVTLLVAKPLLSIFYPALAAFNQPFSGMIAGRKSFFARLEFSNDYGVDVGILIDMYLMKARAVSVTIGHIENKSKPWVQLGKMTHEVSRAIISRSQRQDPEQTENEMETIEAIQQQFGKTITEKLAQHRRMIIFDTDNTILEGRFINRCADLFGFKDQLIELWQKEKDPIILTKRIGRLLKGRSMDELLEVAENIPMVQDIREVVDAYKQEGFIVGIISNSYLLITNYVKQQLKADFSIAHKLEYVEGRATGEVQLPSYFFASADPLCTHGYCKTHAMQAACKKYNVAAKNCIVVGDSMDDLCMILSAGKGFAFRPTDLLREQPLEQIDERSFRRLLTEIY